MNKRKSFTLIELLVVLAIISILSVISIISYSSFKEKAKENNDIITVTDMNQAITLYKIENKIECLSDVYHALNKVDLLDDLNTNISDRAYFWDQETDLIIYADNNYNVLNKVSNYSNYSNWIKLDYSYNPSIIDNQSSSFSVLFK